MAACTYMVRHARLRLRLLQSWLTSVYSLTQNELNGHSAPACAIVPQMVGRPTLCDTGHAFQSSSSFSHIGAQRLGLGWGTHTGKKLSTQKFHSQYINVKELKAILLAYQVFLPFIQGRIIQFLTDNTSVMFCINKQGGARLSDLYQEAMQCGTLPFRTVSTSWHLTCQGVRTVWLISSADTTYFITSGRFIPGWPV